MIFDNSRRQQIRKMRHGDSMTFDSRALRAHGWQDPPADFSLSAGQVQLWLIKVPAADSPMDSLLARLSPAERDRAKVKRIASKQREYITGQAALRTVLARHLDINPQSLEYARGRKGKPYLADAHRGVAPANLQFNISHSGAMVMMAIALQVELGVDIELHNDHTDLQRVARRTFTDNERAALNTLDDQAQRAHFFQMWTCKEALVKCTGLGIHSGMSNYEIVVGPKHRAHVNDAWGSQAGVERFSVMPLALGQQHSGALVYDAGALHAQHWILDQDPDPLTPIR